MKTRLMVSTLRAAFLCAVVVVTGCVSEMDTETPAGARLALDDRGKAEHDAVVEIPEIFELANVAIAISEEGLKNPYRVHKHGPYYERVLKHFLPFKGHPLITQPDLHRNYTYFFRDNSVCFRFEGDTIVPSGYPPMRTPDLFGKHRAAVEDFAAVSGFRRFYRDNLPYYREQIQRYEKKVPLRRMQTWLEARSPVRNLRYRIVFSPLLGSSHETCGFETNGMRETFMFVSGPGERGEEDNPVDDALLAKSVFTEIDHNYVNRITAQFASRVNEAFAAMDRWSNRQSADSYPRPEYVFNEYMTWGVFLLYAADSYDRETFGAVRKLVVDQMVNGRKFGRFAEFSDELLRLHQRNGPPPVLADFYPAILAWAEGR